MRLRLNARLVALAVPAVMALSVAALLATGLPLGTDPAARPLSAATDTPSPTPTGTGTPPTTATATAPSETPTATVTRRPRRTPTRRPRKTPTVRPRNNATPAPTPSSVSATLRDRITPRRILAGIAALAFAGICGIVGYTLGRRQGPMAPPPPSGSTVPDIDGDGDALPPPPTPVEQVDAPVDAPPLDAIPPPPAPPSDPPPVVGTAETFEAGAEPPATSPRPG